MKEIRFNLPDLSACQSTQMGANIYIPRRQDNRREWGSRTAYRMELGARNAAIYQDYLSGMRMKLLAEQYFLSEKSIQRIIRQERQKNVG